MTERYIRKPTMTTIPIAIDAAGDRMGLNPSAERK